MDPRAVAALPAPPHSPAIPRATGVVWRLAPFADQRRVDRLLRLFGTRFLPLGVSQGRLAAMGLPSEITAGALRRVRALDDWDVAWTWAAQRFLGESRVQKRTGHLVAAALSQRHAALAYHLAAMLVFDNPREIRTLRASTSTLFARAMPVLRPAVQRVAVPWRTTTLPGYLVCPEQVAAPCPLVVFLNGTSTSKEETLLWSDPFLENGLAVLALDWPGSGESALAVAPTADCDDFTDGVFALAATEPAIDAMRVGLLGVGLGGAVAALAAAQDRRVGAVVAVTPPYDPRPWFGQAQPLVRRHLATLVGDEGRTTELAAEFALPGVIERVRCPMLVIGAGRDIIVPPEEALRYCAAAGERGTLLWYRDGGHGLYDVLPEWSAEAARWLAAIFAGITPTTTTSTWVDDAAGPLAAPQ